MTHPVLARGAHVLEPERLGRFACERMAAERAATSATVSLLIPPELRGEPPVRRPLLERVLRIGWIELAGQGPVLALDAETGEAVGDVREEDPVGALPLVRDRAVLLSRARGAGSGRSEADRVLAGGLVDGARGVLTDLGLREATAAARADQAVRMLFGAVTDAPVLAPDPDEPTDDTARGKLLRRARHEYRLFAAQGAPALLATPPSAAAVIAALRLSVAATAICLHVLDGARHHLRERAAAADVDVDRLWCDALGGEAEERVRWLLEVGELARSTGAVASSVVDGSDHEDLSPRLVEEWTDFVRANGFDAPGPVGLTANRWLDGGAEVAALVLRAQRYGPPIEPARRAPDDPSVARRKAQQLVLPRIERGSDFFRPSVPSDEVAAREWLRKASGARRRCDDLHLQSRWLVGLLRSSLPDASADDVRAACRGAESSRP